MSLKHCRSARLRPCEAPTGSSFIGPLVAAQPLCVSPGFPQGALALCGYTIGPANSTVGD